MFISIVWFLLIAGDDPRKNTSAEKTPPAAETSPAAQAGTEPRPELNLLGKADTQSGQSRRNENVQFNLIDNNAQKDINLRVGATATVVDEFLADRNYFSAEYGNPPKPPLHIAPLKANGFHGSIFETHMNSVARARTFFQVGRVQPAHENQYGFQAGGDLWKGGGFTLEGSQQKIRGSVNGNVLVPRLDERTPLAADPAVRSVVQKYLDAYPATPPNRPDIDPHALNTNSAQAINTDSAMGRLDQVLGPRDRLSAHYLFTDQNVLAYHFVAGQNPDTTTKAHTARLTWSRNWTPATVMHWSAGFERIHSLLVPEPHAVGPKVDLSNALETLGPSGDIPIDRAINRYRYAGELQQDRGGHRWSVGFELARRQVNGDETSAHRGVIYFRNDFGNDAITNLRLGLSTRFSSSIGSTHRGFRTWEPRLHVSDDWHVRPNLTLQYGLRYEPICGPTEVNRMVEVPFRCDTNNLAPRFGFAWRAPARWGVVRAAYGAHFLDFQIVTLQQVRFNSPNNLKIEIVSPDIVNPYSTLTPDQLQRDARSIKVELAPNLVAPYSHQYNFSWEPAVSNRWKLALGYVGSRSHKLPLMSYTNRALVAPGIAQTTATINLRRPDPRYFDLRVVETASIAYYDAARVSVIAPNWHGLSFDAAYWFSKSIDLGASYTNTATGEDARQGQSQTQNPLREDLKGLSSFDQPHALLARASYITPGLAQARTWLRRAAGNWNVMAILLEKNGTPFTVISGADGPGYGNVDGAPGDRPNVIDPSVLGRTIGHPDTSRQLLPRSAFAFIRPTDARGNIGVNTFRRGGIHNLNAALGKDWRVAGEKTVSFRAESVNLLNTPQFAEPSKELSSPSFGQITNTLNEGRTFQFTLRFRW